MINICSLMHHRLIFKLVLLNVDTCCLGSRLDTLYNASVRTFVLPTVLVLVKVIAIFDRNKGSESRKCNQAPRRFGAVGCASTSNFLRSRGTFDKIHRIVLSRVLGKKDVRAHFNNDVVSVQHASVPMKRAPLSMSYGFKNVRLCIPTS